MKKIQANQKNGNGSPAKPPSQKLAGLIKGIKYESSNPAARSTLPQSNKRRMTVKAIFKAGVKFMSGKNSV